MMDRLIGAMMLGQIADLHSRFYKMVGQNPPSCECGHNCLAIPTIYFQGKVYCLPCACRTFQSTPDGKALMQREQKKIEDQMRADLRESLEDEATRN